MPARTDSSSGEPTPRALQRLEALADLESGWDGGSAEPPALEALDQARTFLCAHWRGRAPAVGPGNSSDVQFEWDESDGTSVFLTFRPDGSMRLHSFRDDEDLLEMESIHPAEVAAKAALFVAPAN